MSPSEALFFGVHLTRTPEQGDVVPSVSVYDNQTLLLRLNHRGMAYQQLMPSSSSAWDAYCLWSEIYWRAFIAPKLPPEPEQFPLDEVTL